MCTFGTSWDKIHPLIELQHIEINASCEKSMSFVQRDCGKEDLLIGFVSIYALDNIIVKLKRLDYVGVHLISCSCIIKHTRIAMCIRDVRVQTDTSAHST